MIVYSATRGQFTQDVHSNAIERRILEAFEQHLGVTTSAREIESWKNSMQYMNNVLVSSEIPLDAGVAIEYKIPLTSRRVDFILTGENGEGQDTAVIVELKQWSAVEETDKDAIVATMLGGSRQEAVHPSYQAWTYAALIRDFNEAVEDEPIALRPCAYLHNCTSDAAIRSSFYAHHTDRAPAFLRRDAGKLGAFLNKHVRAGDRTKILYRIDHGRLRPSKNLADHLAALLQGNREFDLIDDQKLVYETALSLAERAERTELGEHDEHGSKQVLIVEGGPGTGKSVVAVNLLVELTRQRRLAHYVTRNAAPRQVYESKLAGTFTKTRITNLFKGPGTYTDAEPDSMDALVVDEAHRLNEKSGLYQNQGENQIMELIRAARFSVFFIDEDQRVTVKDIGEKAVIREWAEHCGAQVHEMKLESQFRCNGSDGYSAWVNDVLQIAPTANKTLADVDYDFRVCDSPHELRELINERNRLANKARLVAGYCWDWKGKNNPSVHDVTIPEHGFAMQWNFHADGGLWLLQAHSVDQVGCIHTCQGLELDYVGVIIGPDLVVRDGQVVTDFRRRSSQDRSIHGLKTLARQDPEAAQALADQIIKNTYRTLMTRGQKGCYVYSVDPETNEHLRERARPPEAAGPRAAPERKVAEGTGGYEA